MVREWGGGGGFGGVVGVDNWLSVVAMDSVDLGGGVLWAVGWDVG